jgi:hypothetical protein
VGLKLSFGGCRYAAFDVSIPVIIVSRSKFLDDKDNPNRYWNRPDAEQLHGEAVD